MKKGSMLEATFIGYWRILAMGYPEPIAEFRFDTKRKFRFDFAWSEYKVAVEIEGGLYQNGRHNRAQGYITDCDKYNLATESGWRILRYTSHHLDNDPNAVIEQICRVIAMRVNDHA